MQMTIILCKMSSKDRKIKQPTKQIIMLNKNNLKIVQINLRKSKLHLEELKYQLDAMQMNVIANQEPHTYLCKKEGINKITSFGTEFRVIYHMSRNIPKASIALRKNINNYLVDEELTDENKVIVILGELVVVSMYFNLHEENAQIRELQKDLTELKKVIVKYRRRKLMILSDTNCRNTLWGDKNTFARGECLHEFIIENEIDWLNDNSQG